jgi:hypothetical protein
VSGSARALVLAGAATCVLTGCGGDDAPSPEAIVRCLNAGGATVELDPDVTTEVGSSDFAPVLTPDTEIVARGRLSDTARVDVFVSPEDEADHAEDRGAEFLKLFGLDRDDHLLRRDTTLIMLHKPFGGGADIPERDRDLARRCLEDPAG